MSKNQFTDDVEGRPPSRLPGYPLNDPGQGNDPLDIEPKFIGSDCIIWPGSESKPYKPKLRWRLRLRSPLHFYWGRKGDWRDW